MSNLIINGNFSTPSIATNSYMYYSSLSSSQYTSFVWTCQNVNLSLQNGSTGFGYPNPSSLTISTSQYVSIQGNAIIQQIITIPTNGYYTLQFNYTTRPSFVENPVNIYLGGVLIESFPSTNSYSSWQTYIQNVYCNTGPILLSFNGEVTNDEDLALTNISFISNPNGTMIVNPNFTISNESSYSSYSTIGYVVYDSFTSNDQQPYYLTVTDNSSNHCVFLKNGALTPYNFFQHQ